MKKIGILSAAVLMLFSLASCSPDSDIQHDESSAASKNSALADQYTAAETENTVDNETEARETMEDIFYIEANGTVFTAVFEDNSSAEAFKDMLKEGELIVSMSDYGNFEKVGSIGRSLPTNDQRITTEPGDIILYQGSSITVYYDKNTWNFTRLGKINDVTRDALLEAFGDGDVTMAFYLSELQA